MAELDRRAGTLASAAPASFARAPGLPGPDGPPEPMQRALDEWYRREPEAFTRSEEPEADDPTSAADRAIALHHLLAYGRLAGERELERLRTRAATDGSSVLAPLVEGLAKHQTELVSAAPMAIRGAVEQGLAQSTERLALKASTIDGLTAERKRAGSLEQSIGLGEALLREGPDQYERLVADAEALTAALSPEPDRQQAISAIIRQRYAAAALQGELGPAGDPAHAAEDLAAGRFRDAFDDEAIEAWRDLVAFQQERRAAEKALAAEDAGIAAEAKLLTRLGAAGRGEAPMPSLAEIEAVFLGEGVKRRAAAERNRTRQLYESQIALQPFDRDQAWIEAGDDGDDRLLRAEIAAGKRQAVERGDWERLRREVPALAAAIEAGIAEPTKLSNAIALYQRHLTKLGVAPESRRLLPDAALKRIGLEGAPESSAEEEIFGGDGQDRLLDHGAIGPTVAAPVRNGESEVSPLPIPARKPAHGEPASPETPEARFPAWIAPSDPAQALKDLATVQNGGAATLTQERAINLLKYWYVQPESAITDADKRAMRDLFMAMPIDPNYLAYEAPIQAQVVEAIRNDHIVTEGLRDWTELSPEQWRQVMQRIAEYTAQAYGIETPSISFNDRLPRTANGAVSGRFLEAVNVIELNPYDLKPPPDAHVFFHAPSMIPSRIIEETVHAYQWAIKKLFHDGKIAESDPRFRLAELLLLQQRWMYISPSQEPFKDDVKGYAAQPREAHAKKVARFISEQLQK